MSLVFLPPEFTHDGYRFKKAGRADLPLIRKWLDAKHLMAWWTPSEDELAAVMADEPGHAAYIVDHGGLPFAYLYLCDPAHDPELSDQIDFPKGTIRLTQFVGDAEMIGVGHGVKYLKAFIAAMRAVPDISRLLVLPAKDNVFAARTYAQCGFRAARSLEYRHVPATLMSLPVA